MMSYCTDCIHYKVCGNEGVDDSAMTYCADKQTDGDLISRQAVLDLCGNREWLDEYRTEENGVKTRGYDTLKMINYSKLLKLPSAEKTAEWISVRKQKPEDYEEVIATVIYDYKDKQEYEVVTGVRYSKEDGWEWAYEAGAEYWVSLEEEVVAWQPLPNPYKAESEEEE